MISHGLALHLMISNNVSVQSTLQKVAWSDQEQQDVGSHAANIADTLLLSTL